MNMPSPLVDNPIDEEAALPVRELIIQRKRNLRPRVDILS